jgi:hypothetical protein
MSKIYVKYKLIKTDNGFITPKDIVEGGYVWENKGKIEDMILVGKTTSFTKENQPDYVISKLTKKQLCVHKTQADDNKLKEYKKQQYQQLTDPLFFEAIRKKELGDDTKWNIYLQKCIDIKNLKQ